MMIGGVTLDRALAVTEDFKLTPLDDPGSDDGAHHRFGDIVTSISVSEDVMVVGAPNDERADNYVGAVYAYHFDGSRWVKQQKLTPSDAGELYLF